MVNEELSDDFVANALLKEARDSTIQYSAMGLDAFLPKKSPNHPKPNTRFLRNIIKETDNHNAALLAKEAQESKTRLQNFTSKQRGFDIRKRQLGDIAAILGAGPSTKCRNDKAVESNRGEKRKQISSREEPRGTSGHDHTSKSEHRRSDDFETNDDPNGRRSRSDRDQEDSKTSRHHRRSKHTSDSESDEEHSKCYGKRRREEGDNHERLRESKIHRHRNRSRSRSRERPSTAARRRRHRRRSHSPTLSGSGEDRAGRAHRSRHKTYDVSKKRKHNRISKSRSVSEDEDDHCRRNRSERDRKQPSDSLSKLSKRLEEAQRRQSKPKVPIKPNEHESDSDPLEEIIGPKPRQKSPVISRGRGRISAASGIDSRFSANYDPAADVDLDFDEENDWEQALEALRDRQKWKQQGAERLKAAGFTDKEIKKWESGGEKREEDVKWAKTGEGREWDRGKYITDDGNVMSGAEWGRLN